MPLILLIIGIVIASVFGLTLTVVGVDQHLISHVMIIYTAA